MIKTVSTVLAENRTLYYIFRKIVFLIIRLLFRLEVKGKHNFKKVKGSFILASNHQSYLDPPVLGVIPSRPVYFVAKAELFKNSIFGRLISFLGALPVDFQRPNIRLIRQIENIVKTGSGLIIFPEGTRSSTGKLLKPQPGIGYLFFKTAVTVIPVYISGSSRALSIDSWIIKPYKIKVFIGEPITFDIVDKYGYYKKLQPKEKYKHMSNLIMSKIAELSTV